MLGTDVFASNPPHVEAIQHAAHILRDRMTIVTDADAWHSLKSATEYLWVRVAREQLRQAGYCESPNIENDLPGVNWYAAGPGLPDTAAWNEEIRLVGDKAGVIRIGHTGTPYVDYRRTWEWVLTPRTVAELVDYLHSTGRISEPGLPAWSQGVAD